MHEVVDQINAILATMDVPSTKILRDSKDIGNINWLLRNLGIRNGSHPEGKKVLGLLKSLWKNR